MRPVCKGEIPYKEIRQYGDAEPYLEERIGAYCSYCEMPIKHVPEVEHIESRSKGGALTEWDNLLLACKYCNTRKSNLVAKGEKENYLWSDEDDTFHPYSYSNGIAQINEEYLKSTDSDYAEHARKLFELVKLGNVPNERNKDRRFFWRNEAYNDAVDSKEGWIKVRETKQKSVFLKNMIIAAKNSGFFSTWMEVFKDDEEVKRALIDEFNGTRKEIFEE